jgi:hypothetical protein
MATKKQTSTQLDAEDRNGMSDSTFAFPRVRKEPLNDARHVRNAIARFDQVEDVSDQERTEAFRRVKRAAEKFGVEMTESRWQDLGKPRSGASATGRGSERTKQQLYAEARKRGVKGRSGMTKTQLEHALSTS